MNSYLRDSSNTPSEDSEKGHHYFADTAIDESQATYLLRSPKHFSTRGKVDRGDFTDTNLRLISRSDSFFANWPMFNDGDLHLSLRRSARALADGNASLTYEEVYRYCADRAFQLESGIQDWKTVFSRPVSELVVSRLFALALPNSEPSELIRLGRQIMYELSGTSDDSVVKKRAIDAGLRLYRIIETDEQHIRKIVNDPNIDLAGLTGVVAQVLTGSLDPLEAVLDGVAIYSPNGDHWHPDSVAGRVCPFRYVKRLFFGGIDEKILKSVRVPLFFPELQRSMPFGHGRHRCVGAKITKLCVDALTSAILDTKPDGFNLVNFDVAPGAFRQFISVEVDFH